MSMKYSSPVRSGISPVTLVAFILVSMVAMIVAFVMYTKQVQISQKLEKANTEYAAIDAQLTKLGLTKLEPNAYLEMQNPTAATVRKYFEDLDMHKLTVAPKDFPTISRYLDMWIMRLELADRDLKNRVAEAKLKADTEEAARDASRDDFNRRVQDKQAELRKLDEFLKSESAKKEDLVQRYNTEKKGFADKYVNARDDFEKKKSELVRTLGGLKGRNGVVLRDLRVSSPVALLRPPNGHVIREEWRTHQAVIDLGEHDNVFPGLVFEAYWFDSNGARQVKARLEVMSVFATTSVCNIVAVDPGHPVIASDPIQAPFLPVRPGQRFVIAGFISPDMAYDEDKLKTIIKLNGGIVQDSVNLRTDTLILGQTTAHGLSELDKKSMAELPDKARRGSEQAQAARELSVETVDYSRFIEGLLR
jgi:hypothetical protein